MPAYKFYEEHLGPQDEFKTELTIWKTKWSSVDRAALPRTVVAALSETNVTFFPQIKVLLQILATLPVSTATSDRSFSTLRALKTYLRNTVGEERLTGLALMNTYADTFSIDPSTVIDKFAEKSRRLGFVLMPHH